MGDIINRIQLPEKCSECGNKLVRVQYREFGDKDIHSMDYCPHCKKELDFRFTEGFRTERIWNLRIKKVTFVVAVLAAISIALYLLTNYVLK